MLQPGLKSTIQAIISGGQTGVDRAALDFALDYGIPCGGWCPKGRRSDDGVIAAKYSLKETSSPEYPVRTRKNILSSHGTLIIVQNGMIDKGTQLTHSICLKKGKPVFIASSTTQKAELLDWISDNRIKTLNIAGSRESSQPGIYDFAYGLLKYFFIDH